MTSQLLIAWTMSGCLALAGSGLLAPIDKCAGVTGVAPVDPCPQEGDEGAKPKPPIAAPEGV